MFAAGQQIGRLRLLRQLEMTEKLLAWISVKIC